MELNKIILGDCLETLVNIPDGSIDFILTDLPYGTTKSKWDVIIPFDKLWVQYNRIIKANGCIALFGQEPFSSNLRLSNLENYKYDWYWKKERLTNIFQVKRRPGKVVENICIFYKEQPIYNPQKTEYLGPKRSNKIKDGKLGKLIDNNENKPIEYVDDGFRNPIEILEFKRDILTCNLHPTQKPLALCEYLIKTYTNEGDLVLDSCCGSGTTCLAAKNTNRRYVGIEKDEEFYKIALDRLT